MRCCGISGGWLPIWSGAPLESWRSSLQDNPPFWEPRIHLRQAWTVCNLSLFRIGPSNQSLFPPRIFDKLVTFANPKITITNSNLELAASVAQHIIMAQQADIQEAMIHNLFDNIVKVWWQRKGTASTTGPAARLLCLQALHQRHHSYIPLFGYIPGVMSDDCSQRWDLSDSQLLAYFNIIYPQS
jgi:hypothetical protein